MNQEKKEGVEEEQVISDEERMDEDDDVQIDVVKQAENFKEQGNKEYSAKNWDGAVEFYTKAIELQPDNPTYYGNRAASQIMLGLYNKALKDSLTALEKDPNFTKAHLRAAKCYFTLGDFQNAKKHYTQVLSTEPSNTEAKTNISNIASILKITETAKNLLQAGDFGRALTTIENDILTQFSLSNSAPEVGNLKAKCLLGLGKFNEANKILTDLLRDNAKNVEALYLRGIVFYYIGNYANALSHIQQALRMDPDDARYQKSLKAIRNIESTKKQGNDYFNAQSNLAAYNSYSTAISLTDDFEKSVPLWQGNKTLESKRLNNKLLTSQLYCNRAAALTQLGRYEEALSDCNRTITFDPDYIKAYLRRANIYTLQEKHQEAIYDYEKARQLDPKNKDIKDKIRTAQMDLKRASRKDHYKILGVSKHANDEEIKKAYRKLALVWHPDRHSGTQEDSEKATKMFQDIGEAYSVLSDPKKRRDFDNGVDLMEGGGGGGYGGFGEGVDVNDLFSHMFSQGMGGMGGGGQRFRSSRGGGEGEGVRFFF